MRPHKGAAGCNPALAGLQLGMEQMPDMHHLGPNLQVDRDILGTGRLRQADRIVEQRLRGANLDNSGARPARSA